MKSITNSLKHLNVMIIEEDNMLSSEIKYMLKKMGFNDLKIHKSSCLSIFKRYIQKQDFNLIICHYSIKKDSIYKNYLNLYKESDNFLSDCPIIFVTESLLDSEKEHIESLSPDNIIQIPFNYNQFKPLVMDSLIKRKLLAVVNKLIENKQFANVVEICNILSEKKKSWRTDIYKTAVDCYLSQDEYNLAIKLLNDLRTSEPEEWLFTKLIEVNSMLGRHEEAMEIAHEYQALGFSDNPAISELTAQQSILNSDTDTAINVIEGIISRYPTLISAQINLYYLYISCGIYDKAIKVLNAINHDHIVSKEQYLCIEECRIYLDVRLNLMRQAPSGVKSTSYLLQELLNESDDVIDNKDVTVDFYKLINTINNRKPVLSKNRVLRIWNNTNLPHRKLILVAICYYFGFIEAAKECIEFDRQSISQIKTIEDAIRINLYNSSLNMIESKQSVINDAKEMQHDEEHSLESFVILSKEAPSEITNHIKLVNSLARKKLKIKSLDVDSVIFQFQYSISLLIDTLLLHNPNHPKIKHLQKFDRMVSSQGFMSKITPI